MADETGLSSSESEETPEQPEDAKATGAESDNSETAEASEEKEEAYVPSHRLREETTKRKEVERIAKWYQENIGDPDEVLKFRQWQEQQKTAAAERAKSEPAEKELTPEQIKAVEKLVLRAMPWLAQVNEKFTSSEQVMVESAEEQTHKLAKAAGFPSDAESIGRIDYLVGAEIARDPKLQRLWRAGNMTAVDQAFDRVSQFLGKTGRNGAAQTKRQVTKLPTPPAGGSPSISTRAPGKHKPGLSGEGGKQAAEEAWAALNQE